MRRSRYARFFTTIAVALFLLLVALPAFAGLRIAAWNIQNLGWGKQKDYDALVQVIERFDLVAVVELMRPEALQRLERMLEAKTGESWSSMASDAIGRGSYKEHYGFLWRDSAAAYVDGAVVFIDIDDTFAREPFSARFEDRKSGLVFALAAIHVLYGKEVRDRIPELHALADYWRWMGEIYPDTPRLLVGDFNIRPDHPALRELVQEARPLITSGATTLSTHDGRYANLYDNIWAERGGLPIGDFGIAPFPRWLELTHIEARAKVSDHAPVYVVLGEGKLQLDSAPRTQTSCIDLNRAPASELARLPHIGTARAQAIIEGRPWARVTDLVRVKGIGHARMTEISESGMVCE